MFREHVAHLYSRAPFDVKKKKKKLLNWFHVCFHFILFTSLAVHPDKITIATGQVAGTSSDGKVSERDWYYYFSFSNWVIITGVRSYGVCCYLRNCWEAGTHSLFLLHSSSHPHWWHTSPAVVPMFVYVVFSWQQLAPHVRVWDSVSLNTLHVLGTGFFDRALVCLAFSKSVRKHLTRSFKATSDTFRLFSAFFIPFCHYIKNLLEWRKHVVCCRRLQRPRPFCLGLAERGQTGWGQGVFNRQIKT